MAGRTIKEIPQGRGHVKGRVKDEAPLTEAAREDMKAQGASELWQFGFVELALATGRAPVCEECDGYAYRAPWSKMVGGKAAIKFKAVTLDALLAKADKDRPDFTVAAVDSHFTDLSISLTEDSADAFACETSTRPPAAPEHSEQPCGGCADARWVRLV